MIDGSKKWKTVGRGLNFRVRMLSKAAINENRNQKVLPFIVRCTITLVVSDPKENSGKVETVHLISGKI